MAFIQNVSMASIISGSHLDCGPRGVLIQIVDPGYNYPSAKCNFDKVFQFEFLDTENGNIEGSFSDGQAKEIADILKMALDEDRNVVVHCHAGLCRSGAVAEVGTIIGFEDTGTIRHPNWLVKKKLMHFLGLSYSDD